VPSRGASFLRIRNIGIEVPSFDGNRTCSTTMPVVSIGTSTRDHSVTAPDAIDVR
jgi:hypothetical protein